MRTSDDSLTRTLGGAGEVYEAYDERTERLVALKALAPDAAADDQRERFLREGQLAARISHPNSVYVFATEVIDGHPVILMEVLPGGSLRDVVEEQTPLPVQLAVDAILQVIDGLEEGLRHGVLIAT